MASGVLYAYIYNGSIYIYIMYIMYIYIRQSCTLIKSTIPSIRLKGRVGHQRLRAERESCTVTACVLRGVFRKQQVSPAGRIIAIFFYVQTNKAHPYTNSLKKKNCLARAYTTKTTTSYLQRVWEFNIFLFVICPV